jgi:Fe2+ transport system protein FeoA
MTATTDEKQGQQPNVAQVSIPLKQLSPGQFAKVESLSGRNYEIARMAEMGLRCGTVVSVTRGGITSIVQLLNGSRLCVRTSKHLEIMVTPV